MQNDDTTRLNPEAIDATDFDRAEELIAALGATTFTTDYQYRLVKKAVQMLDAAISSLDAIHAAAGLPTDMLIIRASNHALAMRMHGATLRGVYGAEMVEDLCDAVMGRFVTTPKPAVVEAEKIPTTVPAGCLSVEEAMTILGLRTFTALAKALKTSSSMVTIWKNEKGYLPPAKSALVWELYRGKQVREAA